jgi:hypothetical protein
MPRDLSTDQTEFVVQETDILADGSADTSYTLRPLTREVRKEILKRHTKQRPDPRTHHMREVVDQDAVGLDLLDYALVNWTGVVDHGEPVPCEYAYKCALDDVIASALLNKAGLNQILAAEVARPESFRGPAPVRRMVGG